MRTHFEIFDTVDENTYEVYSVDDESNEIIDDEPWFIGSKIDCEEWIHNTGQLNIYYN